MTDRRPSTPPTRSRCPSSTTSSDGLWPREPAVAPAVERLRFSEWPLHALVRPRDPRGKRSPHVAGRELGARRAPRRQHPLRSGAIGRTRARLRSPRGRPRWERRPRAGHSGGSAVDCRQAPARSARRLDAHRARGAGYRRGGHRRDRAARLRRARQAGTLARERRGRHRAAERPLGRAMPGRGRGRAVRVLRQLGRGRRTTGPCRPPHRSSRVASIAPSHRGRRAAGGGPRRRSDLELHAAAGCDGHAPRGSRASPVRKLRKERHPMTGDHHHSHVHSHAHDHGVRTPGVARIGIGGPVGSGKTALIEALVPRLLAAGHQPLVVTNDIFTREDAEHVVGVETGSCPHTAVRDDPSMNLDAIEELTDRFPDADVVLVESGGDNLTLTFSSALADYFIFVIDVAEGDKIPRKRGPGVTNSPLPDEVIALDESLNGALDVGAAGKVGLLDLALSRHGGVTRVRRHYQRAPLHLYRPIYLDDGRPDMAFLFLQQSGDGLVQGDRYRVDIDCGPGSATHVTTQAATNVFGARQNFATQLVNLRVGAGAGLEYMPDPVVPVRGSRLFQRTCVTVDPEATAIFGETLLPGRVAHEEAHVYDLYWGETEARRPDETLLFADVLRFNPGGGESPSPIALLGPYDVIAALYVVSRQTDPPDMVAVLRRALTACRDVLVGVSELPNGCGAVVKLLGPSSKTVQAIVPRDQSAR